MIVDSTGSITVQDDAAAQFSVFDAITLESDGTIAFNAGLTSDTGAISTTADFEDDNTGLITFATGVTLDSAGLLTLNARDQLLDPAGILTLNADAGVTLSSNVDTLAGLLTIDADNDNNGSGTLSLQAITGNTQNLTVEAADLALNDDLANLGTFSLTATNNRTVGLGAVGGDLNLSGTEVDRIAATTFSVTVNNPGTISVGSLTVKLQTLLTLT